MSIPYIFGNDLTLLYPIVKEFVNGLEIKDYKFISLAEYEKMFKTDDRAACKLYWNEIFYRIQLSSILNLNRNIKWIDSIESAYKLKNHLAFCSSIRGLIESTADSCYAFNKIPFHLIENFSLINGVFKQTHNYFVKSQPLEDDLISFLFASKIIHKDNKDKVYEPKTNKEYITAIDGKIDGKIYKFYSLLCEVVHPAHFSLSLYTKNYRDDSIEVIQISPNADEHLNESLIVNNRKNLIKIFECSLIPSLTNLRVINLFEIDELNLNLINNIHFEQFEFWTELMKRKN